MARPKLPFRTDHPRIMRTRERLADLVYPGGLDRHAVATFGGADAAAGVTDLALARLAHRTADQHALLTLEGPLVREMTGRITDEQRAELMTRLDDHQRRLYDAAPPEYQAVLAVTLGVFHDVPGVGAATGMSNAMPPADVHAMAHQPWAAGGDLGYADALDQLFTAGGVPIEAGTRVLDVGCSSGRVVRALKAAHPDAEYHGCDPNEPAIAWAKEWLPGIDFFVSPQRPPVALEDDSIDLAYAISIWSHFNAEPGLLWLGEMARLLRSGGLIAFSTHGFQSVAIRAGRGEAWNGHLVRAANEMYSDGFSFFNPFGAEGDWGVVDADWGMAFLTPEWLLPRIAEHWELVRFLPAALEEDQDMWVLRRR